MGPSGPTLQNPKLRKSQLSEFSTWVYLNRGYLNRGKSQLKEILTEGNIDLGKYQLREIST